MLCHTGDKSMISFAGRSHVSSEGDNTAVLRCGLFDKLDLSTRTHTSTTVDHFIQTV